MMQEENRIKLYNLVIAIKTLSLKIEDLKRERDLLLAEFKDVQLIDDKLSNNG